MKNFNNIMRFKQNYAYIMLKQTGVFYLTYMLAFVIAFNILVSCTSSENKKQETTQQTVKETVPTISLNSLANLGIKIILWMESPKDFEALHNAKLYRNKTVPVIYFQSKEKIRFPYLWFEKKGEMELVLISWGWNEEKRNHLEYLLSNKDKKFVVIGCYNDKEFEGILHEY